MILKDSKGLEVECELATNGDGSSYVNYGTYVETGKEPTEDEYDWITDNYPEAMDEYAYDRSCMAAEAHFEGDR